MLIVELFIEPAVTVTYTKSTVFSSNCLTLSTVAEERISRANTVHQVWAYLYGKMWVFLSKMPMKLPASQQRGRRQNIERH
jgi:hypothetical protein